MGRVFGFIIWGVSVISLMLNPLVCRADSGEVAVLLSREITPYIKMVEGLESALVNRTVQRFFLDRRGQPYSLSGGDISSASDSFDTLVAVGPAALRYLQPRTGSVPLVYGMVLNPQNVISDQYPLPSGISLNIPVQAHLSAIARTFPTMTRLGVLFDPANNQPWYDEAGRVAAQLGLELVPLQISRHYGKLTMVGDFNSPDGVLFIPDKSIISKAVIQYVITQAALRNIPVIGYNQFFYDNGAALALTINYYAVGQQVAQLVEQHAAVNNSSKTYAPAFDIHINDDVLKSLLKQP